MTAPDGLIDSLGSNIDQVLAYGNVGDEVLMVLSGSTSPWFTGDNQAQSVSLVVPADDDFYVERLNIYLAAKKVNQADLSGNTSDLTFRPAMWVSTDNGGDPNITAVVQDANATWQMSDTFNGTYQGDIGLQVACAYSARYGQGPVLTEIPISAWPGFRKFWVPQKLRRGSTVSFSITPTFSRAVNATVKAQFHATVVLTGHKNVRRTG